MPEFHYVACEIDGRQVTGTLVAEDRQEATRSLNGRKLFPLEIELSGKASVPSGRPRRRVPARHVAMVYAQLPPLLRSGVPLLRSLELVQKQVPSPTLKLVLQDVHDRVANGSHLAEAMQQHPTAFSEMATSMVRAGEEGSFLEDVLQRIAELTDHQEDLKSRVLGALAYPVFLMIVGSVLVTAMLVFFVPKFAPIFDRLAERGQLPWTTTTLMGLSDFLAHHGLVLMAVLAGGGWGVTRYAKSQRGRLAIDALQLRLAGIGPILRGLAVARFCRILGTLLRNGVPLLASLDIARDAAGNRLLSESIRVAADNVSAGKSLAQPLAASNQFPEEVIEMIAIGEEANKLEDVLVQVAETLERRVYRQLELFVRMVEPVMLLVMAGLVLFVFAGLLLPVFQSSSALS